MTRTGWRERLSAAIETTGRSRRSISLAAGLGPSYISGILNEGKDPTIDNLIAICQQINVGLSQIVYGIEVSAEAEEILSLLEAYPEARAGILQILKSRSNSGNQ
tara:strand:- start:476 stop:790 length:315 start_codon:yes stop_codon:yes gene_type:complete